MKTCIMSANCQGEVLNHILKGHPVFAQEWEIKYYVNFHKTPIPEGEIENCDLLLYQRLGEQWGALSSSVLLARLPKNAKAICLPNISNYRLWPTAVTPKDAYNLWFDTYIEDLISRKLSYSEIIYVAMRADFSKLLELSKRVNKSLVHEHAKNYFGRERIFKFIENNWKKNQLFSTPNHPAGELLLLVANLILGELNFISLRVGGGVNTLVCDRDLFLPVHPFYIKHYGIEYLTEDTKYPVFGNSLTYKEYLMAYVNARQHEIPLLRYFQDLKQ